MGQRGTMPAAIVDFGGGHKIAIYGHGDVYGVPTVELRCACNLSDCMRPEDADRLAGDKARGQDSARRRM